MQIIDTLTADQALKTLQGRAQHASKDFLKNPNATRWIAQTRTAFVYQQAYYFFGSVTRTPEQKHNLLVALSRDPDCNWGDAICLSALGVTLFAALREHGNCP